MRLNLPLIISLFATRLKGYYTKDEIDSAISLALSKNVVWKPAINNFGYANDLAALVTNFPNPLEGWTTSIIENNKVYRYDADTLTWIQIDSGSIPMASETLDGRMSHEDFIKLLGLPDALELQTLFAQKEPLLPAPGADGSALFGNKNGLRYWSRDGLGHVITWNAIPLETRKNLNFSGTNVKVYDDTDIADTISVKFIGDDKGTALWTTSSDFNTSGSVFDTGIKNPADNNELKLALDGGLFTDNYILGTNIDWAKSSNVEIQSGKLQILQAVNTGSGIDGDYVVPYDSDFYQICSNGRSYSDAVSFNVKALGTDYAILDAVPDGLAIGDEVILINMMGINSAYANVGVHEFLTIMSIDTSINKVTFSTTKANNYGNNSYDDSNIGITTNSNQMVVLQRVPNYRSFTINPGITLNCSAFNGKKYGLILFRVKTNLTLYGNIDASGKGYPSVSGNGSYGIGGSGGYGYGAYYYKAEYTLRQTAYGGAGGHITTGENGTGTAYGGSAYDSSDESNRRIYFGSAGGTCHQITMSGSYGNAAAIGVGGAGGGAIVIFANNITMNGTITAAGGAGTTKSVSTWWGGWATSYGGAGAGGTVQINTYSISVGTNILSSAGSTLYHQGGAGKTQLWYKTKTGSDFTATPIPVITPINTYTGTALAQSTNVLSGETVTSIGSITVYLNNKSVDTTVNLQVSNDAINWYSPDGIINADAQVYAGNNTFDLSPLGWSTANFYYRFAIINTGETTPIFDYTVLDYEPKGYFVGDQIWKSAPYSAGTGTLIKPQAMIVRWSKSALNLSPKFRIVCADNSDFLNASYYPSYSEYFQEGTTFDISNGVYLDLTNMISAFFEFWRVEAVFNTGSDITSTPTVFDISFDYLIDTTVRVIDAYTTYTVQLNRGLKADMPTLVQGEPYVTLDSNELYYGSLYGNIKISDVIISETLPTTGYTNQLCLNPITGALYVWDTTTSAWVNSLSWITTELAAKALKTETYTKTEIDNFFVSKRDAFIIPVFQDSETVIVASGKVRFRVPYPMTITTVRANLFTSSSLGNVQVDIKISGTSILSSAITIDATQTTNTTSATPGALKSGSLSLVDDSEIVIDILSSGTDAKGLKVYLIGHQ